MSGSGKRGFSTPLSKSMAAFKVSKVGQTIARSLPSPFKLGEAALNRERRPHVTSRRVANRLVCLCNNGVGAFPFDVAGALKRVISGFIDAARRFC